jgi:hypothetical protein
MEPDNNVVRALMCSGKQAGSLDTLTEGRGIWKVFVRVLSFLGATIRALHAWKLLRDSIDELLQMSVRLALGIKSRASF